MGYMTLFQGSEIHHLNSGLKITHDMYMKSYFMLPLKLTPDRRASEGHTSLPENGNIRMETPFSKTLPESITFLLYLEYDSRVLVNLARKLTTDF